jgi:hypothetical protein
MAARRRRIIPIPRRLPTLPAASPYGGFRLTGLACYAFSKYYVPVPLIRPLPGTPWSAWSATLPNLPEIQSFDQPLNPNPGRPALWTSPFNAPLDLPSPANTPVWPLPSPARVANAPPALPYWWEPGTFPVQPFNTAVPLRLHPHIIYNPINPSVPMLQWDILHRAEQARILTGRQVTIPVNLDAQAVLPNVSKIYISSVHPLLALWMESWGPIMVEKPDITIRDILDAIYEYFQKPLTRRDFRRISESPYSADYLTISAHRRAKASYELYFVGLASGFRRVDVMGRNRQFQGLRPVIFQDNTCKLFLGLLPLP